ncbi:hypothetical protein evm_002766 [Chilo suppressalis]|nr:hypothetical protein evm_002766 [Chilo suppressalis]
MQTKAKAEALKKPSQPKTLKEGEKKQGEEGSGTVTTTASMATTAVEKTKAKPKDKEKEKRKDKEDKDKKLTAKPSLAQQPVVEKEPKPSYVLYSYEPDPIVEKEERERINLLAQRDFLIRSYGMLEQVSRCIRNGGDNGGK